MWRMRLFAGLNLVLLAALAWLPLWMAVPASADHESGTPLQAVRSTAWLETFCVEDALSSMSFADVYGRVNATLTWENGSGDWHQHNGNKIYFEDAYVSAGVGCNGLNAGTNPRRTDVEIEYHARDSSFPGWCGGTSCAEPTGVTYSFPGGTAYQYYDVYLKTSVMQGDDFGNPNGRRHLVNHETGHVFGLADGYGPPPCPSSVMHTSYYGCSTTFTWPTSGDFSTVTNVSNR